MRADPNRGTDAPARPVPVRRQACQPQTATALTLELTRRGITGIDTAAAGKFAVISVAAGLTVCTGGRQLWCTRDGQRHTWIPPNLPRPVSPSSPARPAPDQ